jgi:hypothetical protein
MGYSTYFNLCVDPPEAGDKIEEFVVDAASGEDPQELTWWHNYALEYDGPGTGSWSGRDSVKWYEATDHILELSTYFPGVLFKLDGSGEEDLDIWTFWAKDGKSYRAEIEVIYPVFDETLLA